MSPPPASENSSTPLSKPHRMVGAGRGRPVHVLVRRRVHHPLLDVVAVLGHGRRLSGRRGRRGRCPGEVAAVDGTAVARGVEGGGRGRAHAAAVVAGAERRGVLLFVRYGVVIYDEKMSLNASCTRPEPAPSVAYLARGAAAAIGPEGAEPVGVAAAAGAHAKVVAMVAAAAVVVRRAAGAGPAVVGHGAEAHVAGGVRAGMVPRHSVAVRRGDAARGGGGPLELEEAGLDEGGVHLCVGGVGRGVFIMEDKSDLGKPGLLYGRLSAPIKCRRPSATRPEQAKTHRAHIHTGTWAKKQASPLAQPPEKFQ